MASFNKVLLMGNLTRDPELTYTPSQLAICKFGLAVSRKFRGKTGEEREEVLFIDCTVFDKKGETVHQYCTKGKPIFIEGQLKLDTWDDKTTGQKRSKIHVVVDNFQFLGSRDGGTQGGAQSGAQAGYAGEGAEGGAPAPRAPRPAPAARPVPAPQRPAPEQPFGDEQQFKEDDIPF
jgi:single-strand DNA-binding protein